MMRYPVFLRAALLCGVALCLCAPLAQGQNLPADPFASEEDWTCGADCQSAHHLRKQFPRQSSAHYQPERQDDFIFKSPSHYYVFRLAICISAETFFNELGGDVQRVENYWNDLERYLNQTYGRDCGIQFDLIRDPRLILRTSPSYLNQGTRVFNELIGEEAYELGLIIRPVGTMAGSAFFYGVLSPSQKGNGFASLSFATVAHELGHYLGADHTHETSDARITEQGRGFSLMSYGAPRTFFSLSSIQQIRQTLFSLGYYADETRQQRVGGNPEYTNLPYARSHGGEVPVLEKGLLKKEYVVTKGTRYQFYIPTQNAAKRGFYYHAHPFDPTTWYKERNLLQRLYDPTSENVVMYHPRYERAQVYHQEAEKRVLPYSDDYKLGAYTYVLSAFKNGAHDTYRTRLRIVEGEPFKITQFAVKDPHYNSEAIAGQTKIRLAWTPCHELYGAKSRVRILLSDDFGQSFKYVLADEVPNNGKWEGICPYVKIGRVSYGSIGQVRGGVIKVEVIGEAAYALSKEEPYWISGRDAIPTGGFEVKDGGASFSPAPPVSLTLRSQDELPPLAPLTATYGGKRQTVEGKERQENNTLYRTWTAQISGKTLTYTQVIKIEGEIDSNLAARNQAAYLARQSRDLHEHIGQMGYPKATAAVSQAFQRAYERVYDESGRVQSTATAQDVETLEQTLGQIAVIEESQLVMPQHGRSYKIASYHEVYDQARYYYLKANGGEDELLVRDQADEADVWHCEKVGENYKFTSQGVSLYLHNTSKGMGVLRLLRGYTWGSFSLISPTDYPRIAQVNTQGTRITFGEAFQSQFTNDMRVNGRGFTLSTDFRFFPQELEHQYSGDGSREHPYSPADVKQLGVSPTAQWVKGTILGGWSDTGTPTATISSVMALGVGADIIPVHLPAHLVASAQHMKGASLCLQGRFSAYKGSTGIAPSHLTAMDYEEQLSIGDAGYATYCSPYAFLLPEGVEAAIVQRENVTTARCDWTRYPIGSTIPAQMPVLLKADPGTYALLPSLEIQNTNLPTDNMLKGTLVPLRLDGASQRYYRLAQGEQGLGFYRVATSNSAFMLSARKAYLAFSSAAQVPAFFLLGKAVSTAIDNLNTTSPSGKIYDLSGRILGEGTELELLPSGIYIIEGKKVVK